jgi:hypothetical protein
MLVLIEVLGKNTEPLREFRACRSQQGWRERRLVVRVSGRRQADAKRPQTNKTGIQKWLESALESYYFPVCMLP